MKTIKSLPNYFRWLLGIAGLEMAIHAVVILFIRDVTLRMVLNDILSPLEDVLITVVLFSTARITASAKPKQAASWRLWAFAFAIYTLGDVILGIFEVILNQAPFPSIADVFYFSFYIFMWIGLVRYPADETSIRGRKLMFLDNFIVVIGASLAFWYFLIQPLIVVSGEVDFVTVLLAVAYPIADMVLLWVLLVFFRNRLQQSAFIPLVLVGFALLSEIIADSFFAYTSVGETFISGSMIDLGWVAGGVLFILAGITQITYALSEKDESKIQMAAARPHSFNSWPLYLPYIWLVISYGILAISISMDSYSLPLYLIVGAIVGLVIFRQILTLSDNERLFNQAEEEIAERKWAQDALRLAYLNLDVRVEERTNDLWLVNDRLRQTNLNLEEFLHEKEVLLKEIHHRVKNNLQVIVSLLRMQARGLKDSEAINALQDSQTRVQSMSLIHEKLYQSKSLGKIDFGDYIKSLTTDLFRLYQRKLGEVKLNFQMDDIALDLDHAVPCGLILNELITNALKYAFPDGKKGMIWVELRAHPEQRLSLEVADDGAGLPPDFDVDKTKTLGLQLVNSLVSQLDGKLEMERSERTIFRVSFAY
jgi:two-component sensor histidine kinase